MFDYFAKLALKGLITTEDFALKSMIGAKLEVAYVLSSTAHTYTHLHLSTHSFSCSVLCTGLLTCCDTQTKTMFTILGGGRGGQKVNLYWIYS